MEFFCSFLLVTLSSLLIILFIGVALICIVKKKDSNSESQSVENSPKPKRHIQIYYVGANTDDLRRVISEVEDLPPKYHEITNIEENASSANNSVPIIGHETICVTNDSNYITPSVL